MPPTKRMTPFTTRLTVLSSVLVLLIVLFSAFLVSQQHAADARRAALIARQQAEATAQAQAIATESASPDAGTTSADDVAGLLDEQGKAAAETALQAALGIAQNGSVGLANPAALTQAEHTLLYVDGPSTAPSVVSVYTGSAGWAAAVRGGDHRCYWVALTPEGRARYGTGTPCTGTAALGADNPTW